MPFFEYFHGFFGYPLPIPSFGFESFGKTIDDVVSSVAVISISTPSSSSSPVTSAATSTSTPASSPSPSHSSSACARTSSWSSPSSGLRNWKYLFRTWHFYQQLRDRKFSHYFEFMCVQKDVAKKELRTDLDFSCCANTAEQSAERL